MEELKEIYDRMTFLRQKGVKMKDMAERAGFSPSVLSAIYSTVLPAYFKNREKGMSGEEALNNAYGVTHWGTALMNGFNHLYLMFNENPSPQLSLFYICLKLPMYDHPPFLRGLYQCFDYNYNPVARRILLVKHSDSIARDEFLRLKGELKAPEALDEKEKVYYDYTCQTEDTIRMCNIPSPRMTEEDLIVEKKILSL